MILLLDTHLLLWAAAIPEKLSANARQMINDDSNTLWFSAASLWEIVIKRGLERPDFQVNPAQKTWPPPQSPLSYATSVFHPPSPRMHRPELLDTAPIPNGGELRLFREGPHFAIKIAGGGELMHSRAHGSEDKLAEITCTRVASRPQPRVLIGGLGMGFTLAAALKHLGANAEVVVAELVPGVVEWNRGPLGEHAGNPLLDPRTKVHVGDVAQLLKSEKEAYDAILLDVDNGPQGLTHKSNDWLYSPAGLDASMAALRSGGMLAIWSAGPDPLFTIRLKKAGFQVEQVPVRAHGNKGARHLIWLARKR